MYFLVIFLYIFIIQPFRPREANIVKIMTRNENRSEIENIEYNYQLLTNSFQITFNTTINL